MAGSKRFPDNAERCQEEHVSDGLGWPSFHRCYRRAVRDGYCTQHHPDSVAKRKKKRTNNK